MPILPALFPIAAIRAAFRYDMRWKSILGGYVGDARMKEWRDRRKQRRSSEQRESAPSPENQIAQVVVDDSSPGIWAHGISRGRWQMARHLMELDRHLVRAAYEGNARIICMMPPRSGKSTLCSQYFPSWYRRKFPRNNLMLWSATASLAQRFSTRVKELCGLPLDESTHSWEHWKIHGTGPDEGELFAAGVGGGATMGSGADCLLVDDYHRSVEDALSETIRHKQQEWWLTGGPTTRAEPNASIILLATRWHHDDLIGFVLRNAEETGEHWDVIRMQAIDEITGEALWPERWPLEVLERKRDQYMKSGYPWMWEALYQQNPPTVLDSEWDPSYFVGITFDQWPPDIRFRIAVMDPSVGRGEKSDYSAIAILGVDPRGHVWIDADMTRRDGERQVNDLLTIGQQYGVLALGCEYQGFQGVLSAMFERRCREIGYFPMIHGLYSRVEKRMRIRACVTPFLSRHMLHFRKHSPGVSLMLEQLRGFPSHKYDDGPDALAMGLEMLQHIVSYGVEDVSDNRLEIVGT